MMRNHEDGDEDDSGAWGRLKFFKEGRCLLELTHRNGRNWLPITKKVYWPPSSSSSSEGGSSSSPTPPERRGDLKGPLDEGKPLGGRRHPGPLLSLPSSTSERRRKAETPLRNVGSPLCFTMKAPGRMISLRKKVRGLPRKRRAPYSPIVVGAFLIRMENQSSFPHPLKRSFILKDRIRKSSRLERVISKLPVLPTKKIIIQTWAGGGVGASSSTKGGLKTVKSELCPVTETCTSLATSSHPQKGPPLKIKAPTKNVQVDNRLPSAKTLPVTPTLARIKTESPVVVHSSSSLMTPDMKRVKVEISGPSSPDRSFTSPRKRSLKTEFNADSPTNKRHRLSTDSLGSRDGSNSPCPNVASPPRHFNNGRMSSFSIDSIISRNEKDGRVLRPCSIPASPGRIGEIRREFSSDNDGVSHGSRTPTPASLHGSPAPSRRPLSPPMNNNNSTPLVSITPYASRNIDPSRIDPSLGPRIAHLAGLTADPRLGLTPTGGPYSLVNPYSYLLPLMQGSAAGLAQSGGAFSSTGRVNWPPVSSSVTSPLRPSTSTSVAWPGQYRGEPKITSVDMRPQSPDAPLNLSMK